MSKKVVILTFVAGIIITLITIEVLSLNAQELHHSGTIVSNIGVYYDSMCTNETINIYWGILTPSEVKNVDLFIKNNKNTTMTMTMSTDKWNPLNATNYFSLTWNYTSKQITPYSIIPVKLTLNVSENVTGINDFSFNIIITGSWI